MSTNLHMSNQTESILNTGRVAHHSIEVVTPSSEAAPEVMNYLLKQFLPALIFGLSMAFSVSLLVGSAVQRDFGDGIITIIALFCLGLGGYVVVRKRGLFQ